MTGSGGPGQSHQKTLILVTKFDYDENTGDYHLQGYRRRQQDREEETH